MRLKYVIRKHTSQVELQKPPKGHIGLSISGSKKDKEWPVITRITNGTIAQRSHCLAKEDVIISINGQDCRGMTKKDVKHLFAESEPKLLLIVEYKTREASFGYCRVCRSQRMFLTLRKDNGTFGFVLRKSTAAMEYPVISNLKSGGPAQKEGSMMAGDRLLEVDSRSLSWIRLEEAASLLQEKNEAVFLIEYSVGIVEIPKEKEIHLEIDCPGAELGMTVSKNEESIMCISSIQQGSLTQRCGVFHVGDQISSINGIKTYNLADSRANEILKLFKKHLGQLTFIHAEEKKQDSNKDETTLKANSIHSTSFKIEFSPLNCPDSPYIEPVSGEYFFKCDENELQKNECQLKSMSILKNINENVSNLQQKLSLEYPEKQSEETKPKDKKLSPSFYQPDEIYRQMRLKFHCRIIRNLTQELTLHMIKNSAPSNRELKGNILTQPINGDIAPKVGSLVDELIEILTEIDNHKFIANDSVHNFIDSAGKVDINCIECRKYCYVALFATRKILLLLSLKKPNEAEITLIQNVMDKVTGLSLPCAGCKSWSSKSKDDKEKNTQNTKFSPLIRPWSVEASGNTSELSLKVNPGHVSTSEKDLCSKDEPHIGLNLSKQTAVYKLIDINSNETIVDADFTRNCSESLEALKEVKKNDISKINNDFLSAPEHSRAVFDEGQKLVKNTSMSCNPIFHENVTDSAHNTSYDRNWKSVELISKTASVGNRVDPSVRPKLKIPRCSLSSSVPSKKKLTHEPLNSSLTFDYPEVDYFNTERCFQSAECSSKILKNTCRRKTSDVMEVILNADQGRFGVLLGYLFEENNRLPIIYAIKPGSPAHKTGVLKKGDRVLAMNGIKTTGMSVREFEELKRLLFSSDQIILQVEFDIDDEELTWGEFTLELDDSLSLGLVLEDSTDTNFVKGTKKGSGAHRCGQLYPGDEILSFTSTCEKTLDLPSRIEKRNTVFKLRVRRNRASIPYRPSRKKTEDVSRNRFSLVRSGPHFKLKETALRTIVNTDGTEKRVLEQEFVLYRDPSNRDFGFLHGENQDNGKAYIKEVKPGGPADKSNVVEKNDRILKINGVVVDGKTENSVNNLLLRCDDHINLLTRRTLRC